MVLVTGATGLLGSHLLFDLLSAGIEVRALHRKNSNIEYLKKVFSLYSDKPDELFSRINWVEADLFDIHTLLSAMDDITDVYHCAAIVSYHSADRENLMKTNVEGTANIVNAALEKGIRKFCHVSSIAALGRADNGEMIDELAYWKNSSANSTYAISKYYAEAEVWRGINEGLNAVIVNPSVILGPVSNLRKKTDFFSVIYKGLIFYPTGSNGFVDVRDVVKAMISLMNSDISAERFIVSSDNMSYKDFCLQCAVNFNVYKPNIPANSFLTGVYRIYEDAVCALRGRETFITKELATLITENYHYSNKKIKETTGIEFVPLSDTIKHYTEVFLKQNKGG
jgi:dihydroflavonol-4-reductase